jgi:hypothetical protein
MSDPTYLEGWNDVDPMVRIRKSRTKVALLAAFSEAAVPSVPSDAVVENAMKSLKSQYEFDTTKEYVAGILNILVKCCDLRTGAF